MLNCTYSPRRANWLFVVFVVLALLVPDSVLAQVTPSEPDVVSPQAVEIVGGEPATPGEWPWQARLDINGSFACGGSLIHPRWVLTAAHCIGNTVLDYEPPTAFQVTLGDHDKSSPDGFEQIRNVVQVVVHPEWNNTTNENDIALLKLGVPVALNSGVGKISLGMSPADDSLMQPGDLATVTGWGATSEGGASANILQEVQIPLVSNAICDAAVDLYPITDTKICAGLIEGQKDSCQGDSGGPLVVPDGDNGWKLAGIVSFGEGCARPNEFGVYTRVSRYISWIQQYISSPNGPTLPRNAAFELGRNGDWTEISSNNLVLVSSQSLPVTPRSGSFVAWLGGANSELSSIGQTVSLNERTTALTFYYQILSSEANCTFDFGNVVVNSIVIATIPLCSTSSTSTWTPATIDLSAYTGRTVRFGINTSTDSSSPSSQFIDDVAITTLSLPSLKIVNFAPESGRAGAEVTITGSNFLDVTELLFNGVATSFAVQSDSVLNATVPEQASTGFITVKTAYSTTTSTQSFTVLQPLAVARIGDGSGSVTSDAEGIDCGDDCANDYNHGIEVTLTAAPASNSSFASWSGGCSGNASECTVTMDAAKSVTATFDLKRFEVALTKVGDGAGSVTSSPTGVSCGADCVNDFTISTGVTLTAQPETNSVFAGWSGACSGPATTCTFTVDSAKNVTATFHLKTFIMTVDIQGSGSGTVTSEPSGISCGSECEKAYAIDSEVTLTAQPGADSVLSGWSGACTGSQLTCTVTMSEAKSVTATFDTDGDRLFMPLLDRQ